MASRAAPSPARANLSSKQHGLTPSSPSPPGPQQRNRGASDGTGNPAANQGATRCPAMVWRLGESRPGTKNDFVAGQSDSAEFCRRQSLARLADLRPVCGGCILCDFIGTLVGPGQLD